VYQGRFNDWYETHQTVFDLKEDFIGKIDRCNERKICGMLPVNKTSETLFDINVFVSRLPSIKN
jgi:hypothetical protein